MGKLIRQTKNMALLTACYLRRFVRRPLAKAPKKLSSVLVVQTAKLGDMVCSTPVFHAIKQAQPQARLTVLGDAVGQKVLQDNPDVDDYIVDVKDAFALSRILRARRFDASVVLMPDSKAIAASYLASIPFIVASKIENGYCPWQTKTYRALLRLVHTEPHRMGHYAPREYLRLLESLGISAEDTTKHLGYSKAAAGVARQFLERHSLIEKKFAVISPSAGNKIKNWPADRFARVAEHIVSKDLPVVIIGSDRDREEVDAMIAALGKQESVLNASEQFSIDELKAFIASAALFVGVDTGPIYIAEAFGVPTVDIVGPMDEREQPPVGPEHIVVVPERVQPELHIMNARMYDVVEAKRQRESISVAQVNESVDRLWVEVSKM